MKMKILKSFILLICSLLFILSCANPSEEEYTEIKQYFKNTHNYEIDNDLQAVFVLTSIGCKPCNNSFSQFMLSKNYNDKAIYLIKASRNVIDLSEYKNYKGAIFYDSKFEDNIFSNSKVIFINDRKTDTIINIEALSLEKSFRLIENKMLGENKSNISMK